VPTIYCSALVVFRKVPISAYVLRPRKMFHPTLLILNCWIILVSHSASTPAVLSSRLKQCRKKPTKNSTKIAYKKSVLGYLALPWLSPYPETAWRSRAWSLVAVLNFGPLVAFSIGENSRALAERLRMDGHIRSTHCRGMLSLKLLSVLADKPGT
jgi:hypothetical protein